MSQSSDDESSDSSNEFLVPADKLDFNSSFFKQSANKPNPKKALVVQESSDDSDDDEFDYSNDNISSAELLSQVLKNLENANKKNDVSQSEPSTSQDGAQGSKDTKGDELSKEISDLLMQGESAATLSKQDDEADEGAQDSEENAKTNYAIPEKGLQIHLPGENFMFNSRRKKQQDLQKVLQTKINRRIRTSQVFIHKVGLLSWLAHGFFLNKLANDPDLLGTTLSLVSSNNYPKGRANLKYIEKFTQWFAGMFKICEEHKEVTYDKDLLVQRVSDKKVYNYVELILLYVATLRGMGINCRLVISLQPPPLKPRPEQLFKIPEANDETKSKKIKEENLVKNKTKKGTEKKPPSKTAKGKGKSVKGKTKSENQSDSPTKFIPKNSREKANLEAKQKAVAILKGKAIANSSKSSDDVVLDASNLTKARKLRLRINQDQNQESNTSKNKKETKSKFKATKSLTKRKHSSSDDESYEEDDFSTDEEYIEKKPKKRAIKKSNDNESISSKLANKNQRKLLSSDDEDESTVKNTYNFWVEVYVESEESWISVSIVDQKIHCVSEIYKKAAKPLLYVVAWNAAGTLKDVTRRYCPHYLTDTRKKRVDEKWWKETLADWKEKKTAMSKAEDEQLLQRELEQPLPKTVNECKDHPLYVLTRHLLKFQALYPPDVVPLGHLKTGEAIYSRHCVHTLCSRETWVKQARVVKPAQEAYKIVKSLPKYDKLSGQIIKNQTLELFGRWQTNPYVPPEAKDGKVPRNEYGNVDLFKMCMLPKGTVYINLPALNRVARKLNIDCAPACVGFNFGCRGALPAFEGFIVCEEYEDTIREAWEQEQIEVQKRAKEKREKRIYGNWKKLIKGLLIREKLATKYNFGEEDGEYDLDKKEIATTKNKAKTAKTTKKTKTATEAIKSSKKVKSGTEISKSTEKAKSVTEATKSTKEAKSVTEKTESTEKAKSAAETTKAAAIEKPVTRSSKRAKQELGNTKKKSKAV